MPKVVLVTGSSNGLGRAIIKKYAEEKYNVVINYNTDKLSAEELKKYVEEKYGVKALLIKANVGEEEEVKNMICQIIDEFGHIDVVVNNAGVEISSEVINKTKETFRKVLDVNLIGTFLVSKYASYYMMKNKTGNIVNISSNNGIDKYDPSTLEYDASKSAIISLTKNLAKEFAPYIRVNCVAPGWIKTDKVVELDESLDGKFISSESDKILLKRFAQPSEIANVVYFLSSDESSYINQEIIRVDGGY